jgi:hypothetical protein
MSIFTSPEDLAADLARGIRKRKGLSPDTVALLEADAAREARQLRMIRQAWFILVAFPALVAVATTIGLWLGGVFSR